MIKKTIDVWVRTSLIILMKVSEKWIQRARICQPSDVEKNLTWKLSFYGLTS